MYPENIKAGSSQSLTLLLFTLLGLINLYFRNSPTMKGTQSQTFWINGLLHFSFASVETEDKMGCIIYV